MYHSVNVEQKEVKLPALENLLVHSISHREEPSSSRNRKENRYEREEYEGMEMD